MGTFIPHAIVRNLLPSPQSVTITIEYPEPSGGESSVAPVASPAGSGAGDTAAISSPTAQLPLAPLTIAPYSTVDMPLDSAFGFLPLPLPYASIRIQYSGPPGSAVAEVSSVEQKRDLVIDSRLANEGEGWAGSGANPWHLDNETESILFLTDMGEKEVRIGFVAQASGVPYYLTDLKLSPHETRAIDMRKLRDAQKADFRGNKIPATASDGSVIWIRLDDVPVMGRLVVMQRHKAIASNYDCSTCICPANYTALSQTPAPSCLGPHFKMQCTCTGTYTNCNGTNSYRTETSSATWTSSNTAVATMDSTTKGLAHGVAAGTATITSSYTDKTWNYSGQYGCVGTSLTYSANMALSVSVTGCPDHLVVVSDTATSVSACPTGLPVPERKIVYAAVDFTGATVPNVQLDETLTPTTTNTCNNGNPPRTMCATYSTGQFGDIFTINCNSVGDGCGLTLDQQIRWCPSGTAIVTLGTLNGDELYNDHITIYGYKTTLTGGSTMPKGLVIDP